MVATYTLENIKRKIDILTINTLPVIKACTMKGVHKLISFDHGF